MKTLLILFLSLCLVASTQAQAPVAPATAPLLTPDKLDQLLGPIALYPDSLIALILPASTVPSDIVLAERYENGNGDPAQIPNQTWDDSVKALTHYPDVLEWLNQNLDWTTQLGDAFLSQPADVMNAIQQLRAQARAAGHLVNTAQDQVAVDNGDISIEPTDPNMIYVPQYDADTIYEDGDYADNEPFITFGTGYPAGAWLNYDMDWQDNGVYVGDWGNGWDYRGRRGGNANITNARRWQPNATSVRREGWMANQGARAVSFPKPLPGVTIPHGSRTAGGARDVSHANNYSTGRDYTGRGESAPAAVPNEPAPQESLFNEYRRGSDARAASIRGQVSRQPPAPAVMEQPPAASFSRPAPPEERPEFVEPRYEAPASAFHMSAGPAVHESSVRGAESRGRR